MDCVDTTKKMVVSPRARRRVLEVKLKEKNSELRELCVREAELIGVLPPETPIEPGESPPSFTPKNTLFMKAMGGMTMDNSTKQVITKDEDSLATLEQEYKIQSGIADAAFGLANDVSISKSLRRKHRLMYQHSQHRISELETRINLLKRTSNLDLKMNKNVMGYHPPHDLRDDRIGVPVHNMDEVDQPLSLALDNSSLLYYQRNFAPPVPKHQIQWGGHYNHPDSIHPINQTSTHANHLRMPHKHMNTNYLPTMYSTPPPPPHDFQLKNENVYSKVSPSNVSIGPGNIPSNPININPPYHLSHHTQHPQSPHNFYDFQPHGDLKRFGSLDRKRAIYNPVPPPRPPHKQDVEDATPKPNNLPSHKPQLEPDTVLLPNQMYPENNIMRTQSLINVRESHPLPPRPWYDVEPPLPPPEQAPPPPLVSSPLVSSISNLNVVDNMSYQSLATSPVSPPPPQEPDVVVPYESPKNQTVVQVGKFQPYREISKPFEMSDFYKYSTKFRKKPGDPGTNTNPKSNNNHNTGVIKAKDNLMEQNTMPSYNQMNPSMQQVTDATDSDMSWVQNDKSATSAHASTFV